MLKVNFWLKRLIKEWLFLSSTVGVILTSIYLHRFPSYSFDDFKILIILLLFLVVLRGLERSNFLTYISSKLIRGKFIHIKIVLLTAIASIFFTNDIALLMFVPITLTLNIKHKDLLIIFQAIAANAGSAILPAGNPQNMFIYWFYKPSLIDFLKTILPFTLTSLFILILISLFVGNQKANEQKDITPKGNYKIYLALLMLMLGVVLRLIPIWFGVSVAAYALIFDRKSLKIDYFLIGIFFMFFGLTDNLRHLINISSQLKESVVIFSAFLSQLISNVPTALFLSDFTNDWQRLLWGVSIGGYGNLIGSLANLIAYRIYITHYPEDKRFLIKFLFVGYFFFFGLLFIYLAK
ncbi:SLC13 family permease [Hippea maritima]|uniref:Citrate transporter n=1 Tax=Hippea maritima (strain ATCC 700847 / DSM 10411 / MH2) TaxID=760142 RepID=F2LXP3_HIPMA|nr:SLC13 family permease [Hippea maritima]AEA34284.1 Citrate transporter [Hippea maritima DSM 10411]